MLLGGVSVCFEFFWSILYEFESGKGVYYMIEFGFNFIKRWIWELFVILERFDLVYLYVYFGGWLI